ncbi:hypothetical protein CDL15_Pgr014441 [Punica granatum]|nr:hypothetical protein CDL15_Pgr014441 [Punica granatum]
MDWPFRIDMNASSEVNNWAKMETNGLIDNIVTSGNITTLTLLVLANALYFKGAWVERFNVSRTRNYDFYPPTGQPAVPVPFMTSKRDQCIGTYKGSKVLRLRYKQASDVNHCFSMCIFLPNERDGLRDQMERACSEQGFLNDPAPYMEVEVGEFRIPKFKIMSKFGNVCGFLAKLDVHLGCLPVVAVDQVIPHSNIVQNAFVKVNEEGPEAAAVTAVVTKFGCGISSWPKLYVDFVADRPFMFVIREEMTGVVLFVGQKSGLSSLGYVP